MLVDVVAGKSVPMEVLSSLLFFIKQTFGSAIELYEKREAAHTSDERRATRWLMQLRTDCGLLVSE